MSTNYLNQSVEVTKCHSVKLNVGQGNVSCTVGPPSHISLWRIIVKYAQPDAYLCLAKKCDCTEYDMFGVSPNPDPSHPMYGLYRFNKALEERSSISLAVGIIQLTTKSTTILLPKKWVCKDIMRHELSLLFAK